MYKRHSGQISMLEEPEFFGSLPLNPKNRWIELSKLVPWEEFDLKYEKNFQSKKEQPACDSRMTLGAILLSVHWKGTNESLIALLADLFPEPPSAISRT